MDSETTGLIKAEGSDILYQPYLTEFYAMQVDNHGKLVREFGTLIKPPIPIPGFLEKQIGITNQMVANAPTFIQVYKKIISVFFCSHTVVAHNLTFDEGVLINELKRIGKEHHFPYPPVKFCTVEQSMHLKGYRLKNSELYFLATGREIEGAHRAKVDTQATFESYKWLRKGCK
jgi:DNA polymerase III epsilon subunit-like protein